MEMARPSYVMSSHMVSSAAANAAPMLETYTQRFLFRAPMTFQHFSATGHPFASSRKSVLVCCLFIRIRRISDTNGTLLCSVPGNLDRNSIILRKTFTSENPAKTFTKPFYGSLARLLTATCSARCTLPVSAFAGGAMALHKKMANHPTTSARRVVSTHADATPLRSSIVRNRPKPPRNHPQTASPAW